MLHSTRSCCIRNSFQIVTIFIIILIISICNYTDGKESRSLSSSLPLPLLPRPTENNNDGIVRDDIKPMRENTQESERCDYFSGKWVYDNETYPKYKVEECIFMPDQLACDVFGRQDLSYHHWRWQPHHCDLPRFNATTFLEKLRNKRLMYVGDSLNNNQWFSMMCMVDSSIPSPLKSMQINGSLFTFKAIRTWNQEKGLYLDESEQNGLEKQYNRQQYSTDIDEKMVKMKEYNATIELYWSPFLVESDVDDPIYHRVSGEVTVRTQAIEKHAKHWTNADFLIFDSYLWWKWPFLKFLRNKFESSEGIDEEGKMLKGFEMVLSTWSNWLELHVNHSKTNIFWMSISPTHNRSQDWGGKDGRNCYDETQPITKQDYWGSETDTNIMRLVEVAIENLRKKGLNINILNITQLSEYRKDAHVEIYRKQWKPITKEQLANPPSYVDCIHWCLPGIPDTWNEILYAYIFNSL